MVNPIKLYKTENGSQFDYYIFDKKQEVAKHLSKLLKDTFGIYWEVDSIESGRKEFMFKKKYIEEIYLENEIVNKKHGKIINVFYGDKKMFLTIRGSNLDKLKFNDGLLKIAEMQK